MIGYGTPASRPCQMCTSVPQTSEYSVRSSTEPGSSAGSANSRNSTGTRGAGITAARIGTGIGVRIPHASFRIRMPRLRPSLRVPDARRPVAVVPVVQRRRAAEADVGVRGAVEHAGEVVGRMGSSDRPLRIVRRPARPRRLQHELTHGVAVRHFTRAFRHRNYQLFFAGQLISLIGTWMQSVAESWLVYRLTGSAALLGVTVVRQPDPGLPLRHHRRHRRRPRRPPAHPRSSRRSLSMVLPLTLAALTLSGHVRVWHVFVARRLPRRRQRLRHPGAAVVRRRDGRPRGSAERDRAQLVDGQRRARRRSGGRGPAGRGGRRGLVLPAQRRQLPRGDRRPAADAACRSGARPRTRARRGATPSRDSGSSTQDRADPRAAAPARARELRRDAVLGADADLRRIDSRTAAPQGSAC